MPGFHEVCMLVKNEKTKGEFTLVMLRAMWDSLEFLLRWQYRSLALGTLAVPVTELPQVYPHRDAFRQGRGPLNGPLTAVPQGCTEPELLGSALLSSSPHLTWS